jgi:hypothetical protein
MANVDIGLGASGAQPEALHVGQNVAVCKISAVGLVVVW